MCRYIIYKGNIFTCVANLPGRIASVRECQVTSSKTVKHPQDRDAISQTMASLYAYHGGYFTAAMGRYNFCFSCKKTQNEFM